MERLNFKFHNKLQENNCLSSSFYKKVVLGLHFGIHVNNNNSFKLSKKYQIEKCMK